MRTLIVLVLAGLILAGCAPGDPALESTLPVLEQDEAAGPAATAAAPQVTQAPGTAVLEATAPGRTEAAKPVVIFSRGGGIAGVSDMWTIYADGTVVSADGTREAVAPAEVEALLAGLEGLGFFEMQDAYGRDNQCADCFQYSITVVRDGVEKTVTTIDAASDAPQELGQAIELIRKVLGA
jgi:hypothetical protein